MRAPGRAPDSAPRCWGWRALQRRARERMWARPPPPPMWSPWWRCAVWWQAEVTASFEVRMSAYERMRSEYERRLADAAEKADLDKRQSIVRACLPVLGGSWVAPSRTPFAVPPPSPSHPSHTPTTTTHPARAWTLRADGRCWRP